MRLRACLQDSGEGAGDWENCVPLVAKERTHDELTSNEGDGFLLEGRRRLGELILPDGKKCFGHFSVIEQSGGYRRLKAGDSVEVEWTAASQDEYDYVALSIQPL